MANQDQNPKNNQNVLFKALTRLFSGPIVNFREQGQARYRRGEMNKLASRFSSASGKAFKKAGVNPYDYINTKLLQNQNRSERYLDFEQMEFVPEINSALNIYADEMTTFNDFRKVLHIECKNDEIKQILSTLYYDVLGVEMNLFSWCRSMCKYGDFFLYLEIDDNLGVKSVTALPTNEIERLEGEDKTNPEYIQFQWNGAGLTLENWQVAHFRIPAQDKYAPYGTSVLEASRRIWRQLTLLEDAMMAYRIVRAPERRVFYVDMGAINPNEYEQHMQRVMTQMKRNQVVDPTTGRVDLRYNPMSIEEDYYIPVRGGQSGTKIEQLQGGQFTAAIDDVKYLRDKLFSALLIPQAYLARGEGANEDKSTLAQKDIRFARTVQRLQKQFVAELEKIGIVHLYTLGFRSTDLVNFTLSLNNPSKLAELQELEHFKSRLDVASSAKDSGMFSRHWIFKNVFKMSDEAFLQNQNSLYYDKMFEGVLEKAGADAEEGTSSGGGGGMGGLEGLAGLGSGEEETPEEAPEATEEESPLEAAVGGAEAPEAPEAPETPETGTGGNESPLLAAPAKREDRVDYRDGSHTTAGSNGKKYKYKTSDRRSAGARTRHFSSQGKTEVGTKRALNLGYEALKHISGGSINESLDREEKSIRSIENLINSLSKKTEK